ncbi:unnamed protein product [Rhizophagus irregularis]|nr:unnamed protein product [Rhizophagus irregularis]
MYPNILLRAWDNVTNDTIKNCWLKADSFTAEEFVLYDDSEVTTEMISDYEILKAVQPNNQEKKKLRRNLYQQ